LTGSLPDARFRRSPAGAVALTAVALGLGGWGVANSSVFETERIEVRGVRHLSSAAVVEAAGVALGTNLVRLSMDAIAADVERLPWVADAAAARTLPSTLRIRVVERTPVAWYRGPDGPVLVARDGTALELPESAPADVPAVGTIPSAVAPGTRIPVPSDAFPVAASMDRSLLRHVRAVVTAPGDVRLRLRDGGRVLYGPPTRLLEKNARLGALLRWSRRRDVVVESIDLRVPEAPSLDPAGGEPPHFPPGARTTV
jgi:cell division protein FtsQ